MFKLEKKSPKVKVETTSSNKFYEEMANQNDNSFWPKSYHYLLGVTNNTISTKKVSHSIADEEYFLKHLNKIIKCIKSTEVATRLALTSLYCFNYGRARFSIFGKQMEGTVKATDDGKEFAYDLKIEQGKNPETNLPSDSIDIVCSYVRWSNNTVTTHISYDEMEDGGYTVVTRKKEESRPAKKSRIHPSECTTKIDEQIKRYDANGIQYECVLITERDQVITMLDGTERRDCDVFINVRDEEVRTRLDNPAFIVCKSVTTNTVTGEQDDPDFIISKVGNQETDMPLRDYYHIDEDDYTMCLEDTDYGSLKYQELDEENKHSSRVFTGKSCIIDESLF